MEFFVDIGILNFYLDRAPPQNERLEMSFLTLTDVNKRYGDFTAVASMNLSIEKGEFVSLLGPSGCGKTTTLQMIAGFVDATSGRIMLDGKDITHQKPNQRGLGIVFQSYALFPHMTVSANVAFGLEMRGVPGNERAARVERALALVHLDRFGARYPRELSGGQRQRVALARALVIEPPVLLLDEPMSNLDAKLREDMQEELRDIQRTVGTTTLMVTHDQAEALSMSDRVVVMEAGRAVQIATPRDAYESPANRFVSQFVGRANLFDARVVEATSSGAVLDIDGCVIKSRTLNAGGVEGLGGIGDVAAGERLSLCLRPEKLRLAATLSESAPESTSEGTARESVQGSALDRALRGEVRTTMFLGNQWLHRIETSIGTLTAICPNSDGTSHAVGQEVWVSWAPDAMHVVARHGATHG